METTNNIADTSSSKKLKISSEDEDRISSLPDSILVRILSLLPTTEAVKTVLLPRFRHLWKSVDTLCFNECLNLIIQKKEKKKKDKCLYDDCGDPLYNDEVDYAERFLNFVDHALILHESPTIYKFHLNFKFSFEYSMAEATRDDPAHQDDVNKEKRIANEINKWVDFALTKKVQVLDLDLMARYIFGPYGPYASFKLPNVAFASETLTELRLAGCDVKPLGQVGLRLLKKLSLTEIVLSEKIMDQIINGCPLLEDLSLIQCYGLQKLHFTCPNIKKLMVIVDGSEGLTREISCPNLLSLDIAGSIENAFVRNVSSLVDASCCFSQRFNFERKKYRTVRLLLEKLSHAKKFTLCTWCILVLTIWELTNLQCPSFSWKCLTLNISLNKWHHLGISSLLRNSPFLETLTMYIYPGWCSIFTNKEAQWIKAHDFDEENYWNSREAAFHCLRHHLKTNDFWLCNRTLRD